MTFSLADPIPYQPWYFVLQFFLGAVSIFYLCTALCSFIVAGLRDNGDKGSLHIGYAKSMLYGVLVNIVIYLVTVAAWLSQYGHIQAYYNEWQEVRTKASLLTILGTCLCLIIAGILYYKTARSKYDEGKNRIVEKGRIIATYVQLILVVVPMVAAFAIGPNYGLSKLHISISVLASIVCLIGSWLAKGVVGGSAIRMASLVAITSVPFYILWQPVMVSIQMPKAQAYCVTLAQKLEAYKDARGSYPIELEETPLTALRMPHLVRQAGKGFYFIDREQKTYSLHLYQDPWISFSYSSATKKWCSWKSNLWL